MRNEEKTKTLFGYYSSDLTYKSNRPIIVTCDYCQTDFESSNKRMNNGSKDVDKDCCIKCRFIKREEVSIKKFGVKNSAQRDDVKNKIKKSKEYVDEDLALKKRRETCIKKYGVESVMLTDEVKEKLKNSILEKYNVDNIMKIKSIAKSASQKAIQTRIDKGLIRTVEGMTLPEKAKQIGVSRSHFGKLVKRFGLEKAIIHDKKISSIEMAIMDYLKSQNIQFHMHEKIEKYYTDIRVNDVIIECDGLRWHSELYVSDDYHVKKRELYLSKGYKPLFFREDEIRDKFDIVKSIINNKLGRSEKYHARKLKVEEISPSESREFFEKNHLMGKGQGITYALIGDEILSCLQVKRVKNNDWEISRFASKLNCSIVGGFSKLLTFFEKTSPTSISTFIDLRYGMGSYLTSLGFLPKSCHKSFRWTNGIESFHRLRFPSNTGYKFELFKIWDCGQQKYLRSI